MRVCLAKSKPEITGTTHILPFDKLSDDDFERLCFWLVEREGFSKAEQLGVSGNEQGRDIIAWLDEGLWAFQCKRVQQFGFKTAEEEIEKILLLPNAEKPTHYVFMATCNISEKTRHNVREKYPNLDFEFWALSELDAKVKRHPDIMDEFFQINHNRNGNARTLDNDLKELRTKYLKFFQRTYRALDFKGIPQLDTITRELLLEEVYVPLVARPDLPPGETLERRLAGRLFDETTLQSEILEGKEPEDAKPLPVEQAVPVELAVEKHKRLVLVGDPGSGKSTLLKHLALNLAGQPGERLPILVPLNAYAAALDKEDISLQAFLPGFFAGRSQELVGLRELFDTVIERGQALILLDGLDEVQKERPRLVEKVETFAAEAVEKGCGLVVTSRIVGYRSAPFSPLGWSLYTLLDFDRAAIELFAQKWCLAFEKSTLGDTPEARQAAEGERSDLLKALDANPGVQKLASNPLLLTILALIKRQGVSLPNRRVKLYDLYLETLISAWSKARSLDRRQVGPEMDYQEILNVLAPLALWLREENPTAGLVSEADLLDWLTRYYMGEDWGMPRGLARERGRGFLESVHTYSNLLLERGPGQYGFMHLTFEEMLAAYGLYFKGQLDLDASLEVIRSHLADPAWRETLLLAVGTWGLASKQPRVAGEVVRRILQMECCAEEAGQNVLLAGACLEDVGELGIGRAAAQEVTNRLLAACRDRSLPPFVRRDAGFSLGRTGWVPDDLDEFITIPAGPFIYQDGERTIEQPYAIARYPVTNRQFRLFWEDRGYEQDEWWSKEGWKWLSGQKRRQPFYLNDTKWNNPLAPVVGVSWYEAEAYCNWLSPRLGKTVRLPTEEEWERAARFSDGREYPWVGGFDRNRLNCAEYWSREVDLSDFEKWKKWRGGPSFEQASTTIVVQFPEGVSQEEVCGLIGNAWEWTDSLYDKDTRALRGGSWDGAQWHTRCAYRHGRLPVFFNRYLGFRVVLSLARPGS